MTELEPLSPREALDLYLDDRQADVTGSTLRSHRYRLEPFVQWCHENGVDNLNEVTGRDLHRFKTWRQNSGGLNAVTLRTQLSTLRVFLKFCRSIDGVAEKLPDQVAVPTVPKGERERDEMLSANRAAQVLEYLERYEYASLNHVLLSILWRTGIRIGAAHSLDVDDFDYEEEVLELRHRPETGTTLKNASEGERLVAISTHLATIIYDYIDDVRPHAVDEHGREPLFSTGTKRMWKSSMRERVYCCTRPCEYANECPHDRVISDCEAAKYDGASKCPSSVSPHAIRRGSITYHLGEDVPARIVSDRMNMGAKTLDAHYDRRTEEEKVETRRGYIDRL